LANIELLDTGDSIGPNSFFGNEPHFESPDGKWMLRFSDQWELRMGLPFFRTTQLLHEGLDQTGKQHLESFLGHGAHPIPCYAPWDATGRKIVVPTLHSSGNDIVSGFVIHDVSTASAKAADEDFWLRAAVWSPIDDRLLLATADQCRVVSDEGDTQVSISNQLGWERAVVSGWTQTGKYVYSTAPIDSSTALHFFDPNTGELEATEVLNPASLVPYDVSEYSSLDRDRYSLVLRSGARGVARLLDDWSESRFDPLTGTILLGVFRPTSSVQLMHSLGGADELGCTAEMRWIKARIVE
jgi:hypothetical protein